MIILPACMSVHHVYDPGTGITDSSELPCSCLELNPGPPEEQSVLSTSEPSLHSEQPV